VIALAYAATQRFMRNRVLTVIITAIVLFFAATEQASLLWTQLNLSSGSSTDILTFFGTITFHGVLTGWIVIFAAVLVSIAEVLWLKQVKPEISIAAELRPVFSVAARTARQITLMEAELARDPEDQETAQMLELTRIREERDVAEQTPDSDALTPSGSFSAARAFAEIWPWLVLPVCCSVFRCGQRSMASSGHFRWFMCRSLSIRLC